MRGRQTRTQNPAQTLLEVKNLWLHPGLWRLNPALHSSRWRRRRNGPAPLFTIRKSLIEFNCSVITFIRMASLCTLRYARFFIRFKSRVELPRKSYRPRTGCDVYVFCARSCSGICRTKKKTLATTIIAVNRPYVWFNYTRMLNRANCDFSYAARIASISNNNNWSSHDAYRSGWSRFEARFTHNLSASIHRMLCIQSDFGFVCYGNSILKYPKYRKTFLRVIWRSIVETRMGSLTFFSWTG